MRDAERASDSDDSAGLGVLRTVVPDVIRRRYVLKFVIALLVMGVAVGAAGFVGTQQIEQDVTERVDQQYASLADQQSKQLGEWNRKNLQFVETMARSQAVRSGDVSRVSDRFSFELQQRGESDVGGPNLHYVDTRNNTILHSSKGTFVGQSTDRFNETLAEQLHVETGATVTPAYVASGQFEDGVPRVAYISSVTLQFNRSVVYTVPLNYYTGSLEGSRAGGVAMVVDDEGRIVFHESGDDLLGPYGEPNGAAERAFQNGGDTAGSVVAGPPEESLTGNSLYELEGREYLVGYSKVPDVHRRDGSIGVDWAVFVHTNTEAAYGGVQTLVQRGQGVTVAGILAVLIVGAVLGRNTSRDIGRLSEDVAAMEQGDLNVAIRSNRIDSIGQLYDGFASMRDALKQQIDEAERARKEAEVSRAEAMEMSQHLQETAEAYSETMQACARGDLTRRLDPDGENQAMNRIATEFNEMVEELELTTGQLKTFAEEVEAGGTGVRQSAETVRDASEQVAESIQRISDDAYDQRERLQSISEEMDALADQLETFEANHSEVDFTDSLATIQEIATTIETAADLGEETMSQSEQVAGSAEEQAAELNEVSTRAEELVRYAQYLGDGLGNFDTEAEHEFVFQTGTAGSGPDKPGADAEVGDDD